MRCKILGCDLDACGVCRRCGDAVKANHDWKEATRSRECFKRMVCVRCETERESPDHDWASVTKDPPSPLGDTALQCSRCGLEI